MLMLPAGVQWEGLLLKAELEVKGGVIQSMGMPAEDQFGFFNDAAPQLQSGSAIGVGSRTYSGECGWEHQVWIRRNSYCEPPQYGLIWIRAGNCIEVLSVPSTRLSRSSTYAVSKTDAGILPLRDSKKSKDNGRCSSRGALPYRASQGCDVGLARLPAKYSDELRFTLKTMKWSIGIIAGRTARTATSQF
jgi:hypothetical protein